MSNPEIKRLFNNMDANKGKVINLDNKIDDSEWMDFYESYIEPFQDSDVDSDYLLNW